MAKKVASSFTFPSRSQQYLRYRSLLAILLLLFAISVVFSRMGMHKKDANNQNIMEESETTMDGTQPVIMYVKVPSGRGNVKRYAAMYNNSTTEEEEPKPISIQSWMTLVSSNSPEGIQAASHLSGIISASPYASVLFETPGTTLQSSSQDPFEFALVNEPALQRFAEISPDRYAFAEHFNACLNNNNKDGTVVCSFANLGGDALLISPLPQPDVEDTLYSHLAVFVRNAPTSQVAEFWRLAASTHLHALQQRHTGDSKAKTWFSTNGMGVSWLHLRVDSWPKYYSYTPFKH